MMKIILLIKQFLKNKCFTLKCKQFNDKLDTITLTLILKPLSIVSQIKKKLVTICL